ncbi:GNAT family N-acetyltransferase [Agromyces sp. NPDC058484]|uniref:GNAT family N-acetyltransferase n=1 Tax=Agromyces sp. NPDC058484 TaxID=3346524 RepID=UPI0036610A83
MTGGAVPTEAGRVAASDSDGPPALRFPYDASVLAERPLRTERLVLRPLAASDAADVFEYQRLPEVIRYLPWPERDRAEGYAHTAKRAAARVLAADGDFVVFAATLNGEPATGSPPRAAAPRDRVGVGAPRDRVGVGASRDRVGVGAPRDRVGVGALRDRVGVGALRDRVIGDVMVRVSSVEHAQLELGWVLHPDFQRRGFAREAAGAVLAFAFETLNPHRVQAFLDARNAASAALCERLGMRREATILEEEYHDGEWTDTAVYGMLRREWAAARG